MVYDERYGKFVRPTKSNVFFDEFGVLRGIQSFLKVCYEIHIEERENNKEAQNSE